MPKVWEKRPPLHVPEHEPEFYHRKTMPEHEHTLHLSMTTAERAALHACIQSTHDPRRMQLWTHERERWFVDPDFLVHQPWPVQLWIWTHRFPSPDIEHLLPDSRYPSQPVTRWTQYRAAPPKVPRTERTRDASPKRGGDSDKRSSAMREWYLRWRAVQQHYPKECEAEDFTFPLYRLTCLTKPPYDDLTAQERRKLDDIRNVITDEHGLAYEFLDVQPHEVVEPAVAVAPVRLDIREESARVTRLLTRAPTQCRIFTAEHYVTNWSTPELRTTLGRRLAHVGHMREDSHRYETHFLGPPSHKERVTFQHTGSPNRANRRCFELWMRNGIAERAGRLKESEGYVLLPWLRSKRSDKHVEIQINHKVRLLVRRELVVDFFDYMRTSRSLLHATASEEVHRQRALYEETLNSAEAELCERAGEVFAYFSRLPFLEVRYSDYGSCKVYHACEDGRLAFSGRFVEEAVPSQPGIRAEAATAWARYVDWPAVAKHYFPLYQLAMGRFRHTETFEKLLRRLGTHPEHGAFAEADIRPASLRAPPHRASY